MKKTWIAIAVLATLGALAWWLLRGVSVEMEWCTEWPGSVRGVGEASETILPGPDGRITPADRERARERARWKAWYYAQLKMAEQLGGLRVEGATTVRHLQLVDQTLVASYRAVIGGSREVEDEARVEVFKDAVRARVVVESDPNDVESLRDTVIAALRSGKIRIERPGVRRQDSAVAEPAPAAPAASPVPVRAAAASESRPSRPEGPATGAAAVSPPATAASPFTGCVVALASEPGFIGPSPRFFDANGNALGSALDLPADRIVAGVPVASRGDAGAERQVAGVNPLRLEGKVRAGDVVLDIALESPRRELFSESLRTGKVLLLLDGGLS